MIDSSSYSAKEKSSSRLCHSFIGWQDKEYMIWRKWALSSRARETEREPRLIRPLVLCARDTKFSFRFVVCRVQRSLNRAYQLGLPGMGMWDWDWDGDWDGNWDWEGGSRRSRRT